MWKHWNRKTLTASFFRVMLSNIKTNKKKSLFRNATYYLSEILLKIHSHNIIHFFKKNPNPNKRTKRDEENFCHWAILINFTLDV